MSVILSTGIIECVVCTQDALPSTAYPVLAVLAEALETATVELQEAINQADLEYEEEE